MPSFQDSAIIILLALLLFGPKGMAKLARELGKLMGEFRRASADFRFQMEEEFRVSEQAEQQKKIAAMEAAAPVTPAFESSIPEPEHPHLRMLEPSAPDLETSAAEDHIIPAADHVPASDHFPAANHIPAAPLPIASAGDLHLMPPATGLPISRANGSASPVSSSAPASSAQPATSSAPASASLAAVFDAIPRTDDPQISTSAHQAALQPEPEAQTHG